MTGWLPWVLALKWLAADVPHSYSSCMLATTALTTGLQLPPLTDNRMCMNTFAFGSHKMHSHCRQCAPNAFLLGCCWRCVPSVMHAELFGVATPNPVTKGCDNGCTICWLQGYYPAVLSQKVLLSMKGASFSRPLYDLCGSCCSRLVMLSCLFHLPPD